MKLNNKIILSGIVALWAGSGAVSAQEAADTLADQWNAVPTLDLPDWQVTGAVSKVDGDELTDFYTSNVVNTLFGRIPGLTVQEVGAEPGADTPTLNSRGVGTFGSGTGLFVVIDGFASTLDFFSRLTPGEIESVELLKDATATAIYGNRAANGVLVVKTKHGDESAPLKIDFGVKVGFQQPVRLPDWLGSYDYATLYNEALANEGQSPMYDQAALDAYAAGDSPLLYPDVNWYDEIFRSASPIYVYNLTASGGVNAVRYFVHFNGMNNYGLLRSGTEEMTSRPRWPVLTPVSQLR